MANPTAASASSSTAVPAWLSMRTSARRHGCSACESDQRGSLRACSPPPSGLPEPIHSGTVQASGTSEHQPGDQRAAGRLGTPEPERVRALEREQLGSQQAGEGAEHERVLAPAVEVALDRPEHEGDRQRRLARVRRELEPVRREGERAGGDRPGQDAGGTFAGESARQPERERQREQRAARAR